MKQVSKFPVSLAALHFADVVDLLYQLVTQTLWKEGRHKQIHGSEHTMEATFSTFTQAMDISYEIFICIWPIYVCFIYVLSLKYLLVWSIYAYSLFNYKHHRYYLVSAYLHNRRVKLEPFDAMQIQQGKHRPQ